MENLKPYQIEIMPREDILNYKVAGYIKSEDDFWEFIRETNEIIKRSGHLKVLADCKNLEGYRPGILDAIRVVVEAFSPEMRGKKIAVIEREEYRENLDHREIVAFNRGYTLRYFTDEQKAETWLYKKVA